MATTATSKQIHPNNAYLVRQALSKYDPTTNTYIVWTGAASVTAGFYEDALGVTAIAGLTGLNMTESSVTGTYYYVVPGTSTAVLASYAGETIYQIVTGGVQSDLKVVTPLVVTEPRYAQ
jgi:hypothetical protein